MKVKIILLSTLVCFLAVLLLSENVMGQARYSNFYAHVKKGYRNVNNATVVAHGPNGYYILRYRLTPLGWAYYARVKSGNYNLYVNGRKIRKIYVRGRRMGQAYAPPGSYVEVTCRL